MISAIGYSKNTFTPFRPQKLGRGKESWLEEIYSETEMVLTLMAEQQASADQTLHRTIFSGAQLEEISAKNTDRALTASGVTAGELLFALYPDVELVVCGEECLSVPEGAVGVEAYRISETKGSFKAWRYRWSLLCTDANQMDHAISLGGQVVLIDPKRRADESANILASENPPDCEQAPPILSEAAKQALFLMSNGRAHKAKYRASALPKMLNHASQVALFHNDRNGYALGIYSHQDPEIDTLLEAYASQHSILLVPFVIPPMIARWDRALLELLRAWDKEEPFPLGGDEEVLSSKIKSSHRSHNKKHRSSGKTEAETSEVNSREKESMAAEEAENVAEEAENVAEEAENVAEEAQSAAETDKDSPPNEKQTLEDEKQAVEVEVKSELPSSAMDEFQDDYDFEEDSW